MAIIAINLGDQVKTMREIKFRGKRIDNGEWIYGDLLTERNKSSKDSAIVFFDGFMLPKSESIIKKTVGQFTGLRDKNCKEIYEGDIVKRTNNNIGEVKWVQEHCAFLFRQVKPHVYYYIEDNLNLSYEVIGNIYENKELLQEDEG